MCTGGAYRPFLHDRHFKAASRFQIGVSRGRRMASRGMLARVRQRWHWTSSQPYLPQYSPDFNPIEQGFSKVKSHLRKAAERTIKGLCRRIGLISRSFNTQECANFFGHAGYG